MGCFIKKIFEKKIDEETHKQFVRFGKGKYENRAVLNFWKTGKIKLSGTFEYANDFVEFVLLLEKEIDVEGIILSKENIPKEFSISNIHAISEEKKGGLFYKNNINNQKVSSENLLKIIERSYFSLLDISGENFSLKTKKKLPKPGKSGDAKIDNKFCVLEIDLKYEKQARDFFLWDISECKKAKISHTYEITEIITPKTQEKDYEKLRLLAKRKGKLTRKINCDGKEIVKEVEFEV